jgi:hypothetical protein
MSRKPVSFLVLDASGRYDLAHDQLQVVLRKVTKAAATPIGYFAQSKPALVQRIREAGIVMTAAAQRWVDGMPDNLRRWDPAQTDDGGAVGASAI